MIITINNRRTLCKKNLQRKDTMGNPKKKV